MPYGKIRILLIMDFSGRNFPSALYALQQWAPYVNRKNSNYETVVAVATSQDRSDLLIGGSTTIKRALTIIREYCKAPRFVVWDRRVDKAVDVLLTEGNIKSKPVYPEFNYGSIVNKGLLLASSMQCQYLVRVDPGTRPPTCSFDTVLKKHVDVIRHRQELGQNVVVSRGYEGRIAVREFYTLPEKLSEHHGLVEEMTGIDIYNQVTGGALFTCAVPGVPAPPFKKSPDSGLTLVWASDDGFYQIIEETPGSKKFGGIEVPRFVAVGKEKMSFEYYKGLAGMVFLFSLLRGSDFEKARDKVDEFFERLKPLLDAEKCQKNDEEEFEEKRGQPLSWVQDFRREMVAEDHFLKQVAKGWENRKTLVKEWPHISKLFADKPPSEINV